jgi:putative ABC transport system ATP-binding protein
MVAVSVRGVSKVYTEGTNQVPALSKIDLDVCNGEVMLLMGPSGSGKTTLLSIMGCILRASSGNITINGHEVSTLPERELPRVRLEHIGFVFQGFNLFPTLTAGENVELALDLKRVRGADAKREARRLLVQVELEHKYDSFPADLSGGQKQRIAIARALAGNPSVILADEPTAALDSHSGQTVMRVLRELAHRNQRTHDSRVLEFGDRIVTMEDGKLVSDESRRPKLFEIPQPFTVWTQPSQSATSAES